MEDVPKICHMMDRAAPTQSHSFRGKVRRILKKIPIALFIIGLLVAMAIDKDHMTMGAIIVTALVCVAMMTPQYIKWRSQKF